MEPLATENPDETKKSPVEEVWGKAKAKLLQWVPALFLLTIEARKKQKMLEESAHKKLAKREGELGIEEFSEFLEL